ncbi:MAG: hypothetical protein EXR93_03135 [Gemmatimonadetes bacterium]|nr:hypothetical protein [Gemmatimonadota bacterium]
MTTVPDPIREEIRERLWAQADDLGWDRLSDVDRSAAYARWTDDPGIGGTLGRYLKKGEIRVYIKDSLLKPYSREKRADHRPYLKAAGIDPDSRVTDQRIKPHGVLLENGVMVVWAKARDWKAALTAVHEWSFERQDVGSRTVILDSAAGKYQDSRVRRLVGDAASRLGITPPIWRD